MEYSKIIFEYIILGLEFAGAGIIAFGVIFASINTVINFKRKTHKEEIYRNYRMQVGRSILLGLELLVASDIIRSVTIQLTFRSVGLLFILVIIRTFLSYSLEVEMYGKWPWQK